MSEKKEEPGISNEKLHYETLIKLYKYTGFLITILIAIGAWIIGSNISDIKTQFSYEINNYKEEIKLMREETKSSVIDFQINADKQIEILLKNNQLFLDLTKDITSMQISAIREDAKNLALSSARLKIEEVFKTNDIQNMIESTTEKKIGTKLSDMVNNEVDKFSTIAESYSNLTIAKEIVRQGWREGLDILDSIAYKANDERFSNVAKKYMLQKGLDYDQYIKEREKDYAISSKWLKEIAKKIDSNYTNLNNEKIISELVNIIFDNEDIYNVAYSFIFLRKITGRDVKTFDMETIRNVYSKK